VRQWVTRYDWHDRADERDAEAERIAAREAVQRRAQVLIEQRQAGELMRRRGVQYFRQNEIQAETAAIQAITKGIELERQAESLPDYLLGVMEMDESELIAERDRLRRLAAVDSGRAAAAGAGATAAEGDGEGPTG
jgi:hypothetical protein